MHVIQQVRLQEIGKDFDFWESFEHLHVSHWDSKPPLFLWKTLVICLVLLQMCVLSTLSSYFLRSDMKYGRVLWQALSIVIRISIPSCHLLIPQPPPFLPYSCISLSCFPMLLLCSKTHWKYRTEGFICFRSSERFVVMILCPQSVYFQLSVF